ncbi:MAG: hypothetical protein D6696_03680 [Acidobacteria bacterium]|nr:MAG: hypothetical protein D6696_03680 [Acidobacteriota bacterium]
MAAAQTGLDLSGSVADAPPADFIAIQEPDPVPVEPAGCTTVANVHVNPDGETTLITMYCEGSWGGEEGPPQECVIDSWTDHHGEKKEWCDCSKDGRDDRGTACRMTVSSKQGVICGGGDCPGTTRCMPVVTGTRKLLDGTTVKTVKCQCV